MGTFRLLTNLELHFWEPPNHKFISDEVSEPVQSTMTLRGYSLHSSGFRGRRWTPKNPGFLLLAPEVRPTDS